MYGLHYTDLSWKAGMINSISSCNKLHPNSPKRLRRTERIPFAQQVFTGPLFIIIVLAPEIVVRTLHSFMKIRRVLMANSG